MRTINEYLGDLELAERCADRLETNADAVVRVLTQHESHETAVAEVESSIDALRNLHRELSHLRKGTLDTVSVFLPINLPLYSLILFGAVPSLMASRVDVRLPAATPDWVQEVAASAGLLSDHALYESLADELQIPLHAKGWSTVLADASLRSDQIHANAAGYERFAQGLVQTLRSAGLLAP